MRNAERSSTSLLSIPHSPFGHAPRASRFWISHFHQYRLGSMSYRSLLNFRIKPLHPVRLIFAIYLFGFAYGTQNHIVDILADGWLGYDDVPLPINLYWTLLTFFDPLAILLLLFFSPAGIILSVFIMTSDIAINMGLLYISITRRVSSPSTGCLCRSPLEYLFSSRHP